MPPFYVVYKPRGRPSPLFGRALSALSFTSKLIPFYTNIFYYINSAIYIEAVIFLLFLGWPRPLLYIAGTYNIEIIALAAAWNCTGIVESGGIWVLISAVN